MPSSGVTISVTAETNAGGRRHMEDYIAVNLSPNSTLQEMPDMKEQAYVGVFDGHGGKEAAKYAREELWEVIQNRTKFLSRDVTSVKEALREAYIELHEKMLEHRPTWQPNKTGDLSTAGTTASTVIFRKNHIFVANVGDSTAIMGIKNPLGDQPGEPPLIAQVITHDHKPEDPEEQRHIRELGGEVALSPKGVMRVIWERSHSNSDGCTVTDKIPFLSVARSLGDYWSFNPRTERYTVSPEPHVAAIPLDLMTQKFVVIASDGLWNVMSPNEVVSFIHDYQAYDDNCHKPKDVVSSLIREALNKWGHKRLQADNISVLIAFLSEEDPVKCKTSGVQNSSTPNVPETTPTNSTEDEPVNQSNPLSNNDDTEGTPNPSSNTITDVDVRINKKRKHKKRKSDLELARNTGSYHPPAASTCTHHSVLITDSTPALQQEYSMLGSTNGIKRPHPQEDDPTDNDEGIMIPLSQKRMNNGEDDFSSSLASLRSERLSTDAASDSGSSNSSSGVSSDEPGLSDPASVDLIMEIEVDQDLNHQQQQLDDTAN